MMSSMARVVVSVAVLAQFAFLAIRPLQLPRRQGL